MAKSVTKAKPASVPAKQKATGTSVAKKNQSVGVPAHLANYESEGKGVPNKASDFLLPMAKVLDAKSPEVTKGHPNRVAGAEAGDIYIKNAPTPLIKGETGFIFQPCYRDEAIIEWLARNKGGGAGAGFVARHAFDYIARNPKEVEQRPHPENKDKKIWVRKATGNQLVETRYVGGFLISDDPEVPPMPLSLPFASTGHTVAKQWNMLMASKRLHGRPADIWLVYYQIKSRLKSRADQSWYLLDVVDAGEPENGIPTTLWIPTPEDAERGRMLHESLADGQRGFDDEAAAEGASNDERM